MIAVSKEKYKFILISSLVLPFLYFLFYILLQRKFDILSLPISKVLTIMCSLIINLILFKSLIKYPLKNLLVKLSKEIILPIFLLVTFLFFTQKIWNINTGKNIYNLFIVIVTGGISIIISSFVYYYINKNTRNLFSNILSNVNLISLSKK